MDACIRVASASDIDNLSRLAVRTYTDAFGASFTEEDLCCHVECELLPAAFERILERDVVLIAEQRANLIGFAQFGPAVSASCDPSSAPELRRLYVDSARQGRGIGTRLAVAALSHPVLAGAPRVYLDVWKKNEAAQRFYRRHGFVPIGTRPFAVASGSETTPEIIMVRVQEASDT
jgi:ribosomal protein S18 acetylase RimI-like enzyme